MSALPTMRERVCIRVLREMETGETAYIRCVRGMEASVVVVYPNHRADIFSLCEIVIFGIPYLGRNLADKGKAYRSFVHGWRNATELVDGKASSCLSSDDVVYHHWWRIEFAKRVNVVAVLVVTGKGKIIYT